ncbi:MAG: pectinesterase family protein [Bacteroidales bacterium]|nr:pectinesterase family protein [Bacteroidales bacterium]MCF6341228.1 pectinesterase family protein [Bacteroidales bacterium]
MKKLFFFSMFTLFGLGITNTISGQTEVKGSGNTAATQSLIVTNSNPDTAMVVRDDGKVGIGTVNPTTKLEVNGMVFSATGGFTFPDGTIQTTAAVSTAYAQVFTVALSGGDFTTISGAIAACGVTSPANAFLIRVMPGVYTESVTLKKYVHLQGAGKYTTIIAGTVTGADSCVIRDFNIKQGIFCNGTSPTIIHNIITSGADGNNGILISSQGKPWIQENEIVDCNGWGILCQNFGSDAWIIANKILRNTQGGIKCEETSPTISNNQIDLNNKYGIYLIGFEGIPSEPTIDDNVISHTDYTGGGKGIFMTGYAEPRIIANDIFLNECGIWIDPTTQPSVIGNNINYNYEAGIRCFSNGSSKPVVIKSNHIHSNVDPTGFNPAGIWVQDASPIITHNNIHNNDRTGGAGADIDYSSCTTSFPMISMNVFNNINKSGTTATGNYNVTTAGGTIAP